jgi:predicted transcriptional regulator
LQVYLESCLCRDVRTIIERTNVISKEKWFEKNNDVVNEFSDISKKLELIRELFNLDKRKFNKNIKSPYEEITRIRNSFIHGHEIYDKTLISGKEQRKETSKTLDAIRDYKKLKNNIANILILERYWNEAIDIINKKNNGQKIDKRKFELEKSFDILDNLNVD